MTALLLLALADPPRFAAHAAGGEVFAGPLAQIQADRTVAVGDKTVPGGEVVRVRRLNRPLPAWPAVPQVILANGDRVPGGVEGGNGSAVLLATPVADGGVLRVPFSGIAAVWFAPPPADAPPDVASYPWVESGKKQDALLLRNGDVLHGTVESVAGDGTAVTLRPAPKAPPTTVPADRVAAVAFDPSLSRVRPPKGPHWRLVLADGTRLTLSTATADATTLTGTAVVGGKVRVPLAAVVALDVVNGKAVPLSALKPAATTKPYNTVAWPMANDRSVKGHPLRLGESWYDRGVGTHPHTTLVYPLAGKYRRFETTVGLDPVTGRRGSAVVTVSADGKELFADTLTSAMPPKALNLDIAGAKALTLVVGFAPGGDVQADVNWADACVVE